MRNLFRFSICLVMFAALGGSSFTGSDPLYLAVTPEALDALRPYLEANPLPERYRFDPSPDPANGHPKDLPRDAAAGNRGAEAALLLERSGPYLDPNPRYPAHRGEPDGPDDLSGDALSVTLRSTVLAPAVPLWDPRESATIEELAAGDPELRPIVEILPPHRALPVDGLYPDDPAYPLIEQERFVLTGNDPELRSWFSRLAESVSETAVRNATSIVWIGAVGDLMLGRGVENELLGRSDGPERVFTNLLPILREADLLLGNLEGAVSRRGAPENKAYAFRFRPEALGPLRDAGFSYLSVTNNHAFDYGPAAFLDTLSNLAAAGIGTSGAGRTIEEASKPWVTELDEVPVTVLSIAAYPVERSGWDGEKTTKAAHDRPGVLWEGAQALSAVSAAAKDGSFDIVMVHGGQEWQERPSESQRRLYRALVDHGADLVIGSHPHLLQGIEAYRGKPIVYSLGNFVFPGMQGTFRGEDSLVLLAGVYDGAVRYLRYIPAKLSGTRVSSDTSGSILERFLSLTEAENAVR
jgi:poly-gamma-glutamate capsule biosynthesis protein CapA/YwtB (metallophosphatase superfamily)